MSCHKEKKEKPTPTDPDAIEVATTSFVAEKGDGTVEIPVSANTKLSVTIANDAQQWLYYAETKAMTNSTVVIGYRANPTAKQRTGNVTIIDSQVSLVVNAGNPKDIGTENGDVQIQNSNVSSLVNNKRTTYASN